MRNHSVGLFDVLPEGPFEYRLLPDGAVDLAYARKKEEFVLGTEGMTHRERKRTLKILGKG
jgi:hypothetical protein